MKIIVTGGAGFIGSAVLRQYIRDTEHEVINLDALTYAGNLESLAEVESNPRYCFEHVDIRNYDEVERVFAQHRPDAIMHLAAESHVDRSIDGPADFIMTNIVGTYNLLDVARQYWNSLDAEKKAHFRFHHVSTDEVYGDLEASGYFTEETAYDPSSPYSASKASSDHLVRAWHRTYGVPVVITNCSNNYGPYQFPEKLIPLVTLNALEGTSLPVYGDGTNIRDWLYVEDHCRGIEKVIHGGRLGETYNIGGNNEWNNLAIVELLCDQLDQRFAADTSLAARYPDAPQVGGGSARDLITFVEDRAGHDWRYAIDASKIGNELGYSPVETFETGIARTLDWFLDNEAWWRPLLNRS